jgi:bifunctional non-homologous end joining protein LigD
MKELESKFKPLIIDQRPFKNTPPSKSSEKIFWVRPELVAEVKFTEWTEDNQLRQASFKGLRTDKNPKDVKRESSEEVLPEQDNKEILPMDNRKELVIQGITISNPDKLIFIDPPVKKGEIVRYYEKVAQRMLPYLAHRILSIVRCPKGIAESCFFKKHPGPGSKGIVTMPVPLGSGVTDEFFYIEDIHGLINEAQMGTLEFHTWGSHAEQLEKPDMMVFDLDPDVGMTLERIRQGVKDLKSILAELNLLSNLKTSGGKGARRTDSIASKVASGVPVPSIAKHVKRACSLCRDTATVALGCETFGRKSRRHDFPL